MHLFVGNLAPSIKVRPIEFSEDDLQWRREVLAEQLTV